uniref:Uncharacterized protein n=1 Tax=Arundo donax TaxID=35708 RepID=A0A0A9C1W6_ARUDO
MPMKPLQFESCIWTTNSVPGRIPESLLMSLTAAVMATLAALPIVELNVKRAPIFTTLGLTEIFWPGAQEHKQQKMAKIWSMNFMLLSPEDYWGVR